MGHSVTVGVKCSSVRELHELVHPAMCADTAQGTHLEELLVALVTVDNVPVDEYFIQKISHCSVANSTLPKGKAGGQTVTKAPCRNDSTRGQRNGLYITL